MHPAPSVIVFTTLSGLGFGLLAFLGLGLPDVSGMTAFVFFFIGYGLAIAGLLAATFHLGNKVNAHKAFSQWRTSWLSREGVCSVAALLVMAPYAIGRIFCDANWAILGWVGALLCLGTVFTTSMIYAQLKTVPRWNMRWTPALFLTHALAGGALLAGQISAAAILLALLGAVLAISWKQGDQRFEDTGTTLGTATGLDSIGTVRQLEPPHSGKNYLLKEMAFQVGRKHSAKLRAIALALGVIVPVLCLTVLPFSHGLALVAILSHLVGIMAGRWLFFAEAKHVVSLYYQS
ncbi:DMSO reductase anchor subunit [Shimia gijangensis]|uniref:DMSO reductase anchor subunit n=1 Tax=Shimia gijangensis TaxID=1470563 RepID=A0A1M6I8J9_9RHOB|nr:DmsC/YnfH family molybdoenzyme membrane anchor subunit [Shimia gijangensis]SHJ30784.1 DMSO reductase anchor subunit [Shimia gijangensis]